MKKKKITALVLATLMVFSLAACGSKENDDSSNNNDNNIQNDSQPTNNPTVSNGESKSYTAVINEADVVITVAADEKSVVVDAMGMTVEGTCEVVNGALTFKEQTSGNAQIWASLGSHTYVLNADGTASVDGVGGAGGTEKSYTAVINDADVTLTISADGKSIVIDAMGMKVEGACEVVGGVLVLGEQTSGNAQIWASMASRSLTLNDNGTATEGGSSTDDNKSAAAAEVLFSWECGFTSMDFNKDGTYSFNYNDMVKESGTWKWENWTLTVTNSNGFEMTGSMDPDSHVLTLEYTAAANEQLKDTMTVASGVWGPALGASGSYTPAQ